MKLNEYLKSKSFEYGEEAVIDLIQDKQSGKLKFLIDVSSGSVGDYKELVSLLNKKFEKSIQDISDDHALVAKEITNTAKTWKPSQGVFSLSPSFEDDLTSFLEKNKYEKKELKIKFKAGNGVLNVSEN